MIRRLVNAVLDAQEGWAEPFGEWSQKVLRAIWGPIRPIKDFLHGTWYGHPLHPAITDVVIGAILVAFVLDLWTAARGGPSRAADIAIVVALVGMLGAIVTGLADYTDTDTKPARPYATVHGLLMLAGTLLYAISLWLRLAQPVTADRTAAVWLAIAGLVVVLVSSYIGGDLVFALGNMVDHHAFRSFGTKWQVLEPAKFEEDKPTRAKAGATTLVVVRRGERLFALHDVCAHAGCNLSEGKVVGDIIECPCHGSRFRLADGRVARGPATFDQPAYEMRASEGKLEARRRQ